MRSLPELRIGASLVIAALLAQPPTASAQFDSPLGAEWDTMRVLRASNLGADSATLAQQLQAVRAGTQDLRKWYFPLWSGGVAQAKAIYRASGVTVFSGFDANLRNDQILTTADIIAGAIGVFPFGVRSAFVVTSDSSETVEGIRSDMARVTRNGGSLAARLVAPVFLTLGPNVRSSASLVAEFGLLGDLDEPDELRASGTLGAEGVFAFSVQEVASLQSLGAVVVPVRLAYAWSDERFDAELVRRKGFWFIQLGFGLRVGDESTFGIAALWSHPFSADARRHTPELMLNLSAALPPRVQR